jgi:fructose-1-phosphate kinase PfkB-like protein
MKNILVVSLSPTIQKTLLFDGGWKKNEVNRTPHSLISASGKGANTARILAQGGESVSLLTQTGGDMADFFVKSLEKSGVRMITCPGNSDIRFCYTLIESQPYSATELVEEGTPVSQEVEAAIRSVFIKELDKAATVIIAGSASPGFSPHIYRDFINEVGKRKITLVIDRHGAILRETLESAPMVVKINMYEFLISYFPEKEWNQDVTEDYYSRVIEKGRELSLKFGHKFVLTNGERDTLIIEGDRIDRLTPKKGNPLNPIGCGDAVTAGTAAGLLNGLSLKDSVEKGMTWAAVNLEKLAPGTIL